MSDVDFPCTPFNGLPSLDVGNQLVKLIKDGNISLDNLNNITRCNFTDFQQVSEYYTQVAEALNITVNESQLGVNSIDSESLPEIENYIVSRPALQIFFYCLYIMIFVVGIAGNTLVCYVVFRNKQMQTVTNLFITNLALSDILLCVFSVPVIPLYMIVFRRWVFGRPLCHLMLYAQGVSVYISAFTLMAIAIDRFFVIIYPFKPRMKIFLCIGIITLVWLSALVLTFPYGYFVAFHESEQYCNELWPHEITRQAFGFSTSILQFIIPFTIISFCYMKVCSKLADRARTKPGCKSIVKEQLERERTRRTNRMLISMVIIFGISWLPLNLYNLISDFYSSMEQWPYSEPFFILSHAIAMSSTCYNPFLYAWLNDNFRKEFKQVLPCYRGQNSGTSGSGTVHIHCRKGDNNSNSKRCNGQGIDEKRDSLRDCEARKMSTLTESIVLQVRETSENIIGDDGEEKTAAILFNCGNEKVKLRIKESIDDVAEEKL